MQAIDSPKSRCTGPSDPPGSASPSGPPRTLPPLAARTLGSHGAFVLPWLKPGMQVLDTGCGHGTITLGLADAVFPGRVTGLDLRDAPIRRATRLAEGLEAVNVTFVRGSTYEMPFAGRSFDFVFSHSMIERLEHPVPALREIRRVMKSGAVLAVCSPDRDGFDWAPATAAMERAVYRFRNLPAPAGERIRRAGMLARLLTEAGFAVVESGVRQEEHHPCERMAEDLAAALEAAGHPDDARVVREWSRLPGAGFRKAWQHAVAVCP